MKYKDLPKMETLNKLVATSFDNPSSNFKVWKWCNNLMDSVKFLENERVKLVQHYGEKTENGDIKVSDANIRKFQMDFGNILDTEIPDSEKWKCPIDESWFERNRCNYSYDRNMWLSPLEIGIILKFRNKNN